MVVPSEVQEPASNKGFARLLHSGKKEGTERERMDLVFRCRGHAWSGLMCSERGHLDVKLVTDEGM